MMVVGIDAHKRSHTAVSVDEMGRQGFVKTVGTTTQDHLRLLNDRGARDSRMSSLWRHGRLGSEVTGVLRPTSLQCNVIPLSRS